MHVVLRGRIPGKAGAALCALSMSCDKIALGCAARECAAARQASARGGQDMERGAATRGKVAKAVAGAEAIEIKATIPDHQVRQALARFGLTASNDEERYIYFFDTPELDLLGAGIIARARRVVGDAHDSTVKFRPVDPADVGPEVAQVPGLQDRGGRERDGHGQVGVVLDAGGQGAHQARRRRQEADRGDIHRGAGGIPDDHGGPQDRFREPGRARAADRPALADSRIRAAPGRSPPSCGGAGMASG